MMSTSTTETRQDRTRASAQKSSMGNAALAFELAVKQRELEINQLSQRNNFFMVFQGVLFSGLIQSQGLAAPLLSFAACFVGFAISISQLFVACGAKYWQIRWEQAVKDMEIYLFEGLDGKDDLLYQMFTSDKGFMTTKEIERLNKINAAIPVAEDKLQFVDDFIKNRVADDLLNNYQGKLKHLWFRRPVSRLILCKFSVSRAPIYAALVLIVVWGILLANCISVGGYTIPWFSSIRLVALKPDASAAAVPTAPASKLPASSAGSDTSMSHRSLQAIPQASQVPSTTMSGKNLNGDLPARKAAGASSASAGQHAPK